jgi:hypothetical protein
LRRQALTKKAAAEFFTAVTAIPFSPSSENPWGGVPQTQTAFLIHFKFFLGQKAQRSLGYEN